MHVAYYLSIYYAKPGFPGVLVNVLHWNSGIVLFCYKDLADLSLDSQYQTNQDELSSNLSNTPDHAYLAHVLQTRHRNRACEAVCVRHYSSCETCCNSKLCQNAIYTKDYNGCFMCM